MRYKILICLIVIIACVVVVGCGKSSNPSHDEEVIPDSEEYKEATAVKASGGPQSREVNV